jgi:4-oxalocrotonate tautomerase
MPLVRIDLLKGKNAAYRQAIGRIVYDALLVAGVPKDDRFQIISEHDTGNFLFDAHYLGIQRTEDLVIIQITWNEGRTTAQKQAVYKAIAAGFSATPGLRPENVLISLVEVKKENWSFGMGVAQYVSA